MAMRDERMGPNGKQCALMFQMNVVYRQINQKVRLLVTLEKFAGRAPSRVAGANRTGGKGR
jgi:hypothetical protein